MTLPELEVRKVRDLTLAEPSAPDSAPHISAASAIVRCGGFAYVAGDDELCLGVFDLARDAPGRLVRALPGDLPGDPPARKRRKPDLEALALLPPSGECPHGALLALGSGSGRRRRRGFTWALAEDGSLRGEPRVLDLGPLYARLGEEIEDLNVEGCCVVGDRLWLLQRGNRGRGRNAVVELPLDPLLRETEPRAVTTVDLGELDGVELTFSDASPLDDDTVVFTASAETKAPGDEDGTIHGSVVGTLGRDGTVRGMHAIDRRWKVEGVHAEGAELLLVCDQDSRDEPSPLLSATMPG